MQDRPVRGLPWNSRPNDTVDDHEAITLGLEHMSRAANELAQMQPDTVAEQNQGRCESEQIVPD